MPFLGYAAEGFVGELQQQLQDVHELIVAATWLNYVHSMFTDRPVSRAPSPARSRSRAQARRIYP